MKLAWGAKVSPLFRERVAAIAVRLSVDPNWLMAAMAFETGNRFTPDVINARSGATGLIQFMPRTAIGLRTTTELLAKMTAVEQLGKVDEYLLPFAGSMRSLDDLYMAILWPAAVGKPDDYVLFAEGGSAYAQNRELDVDKDKTITKAEASAFVRKRLVEGLLPQNVADDGTQPAAPIEDHSLVVPEENQMGALLAGLLPSIIGMFQPIAQQKVSGFLSKAGVDSAASNAFLDVLLASVAKVAGTTPDEMKANDALAISTVSDVLKSPEKIAVVEQSAIQQLDALMPMFDRLHKMSQDEWAEEERSKAAAATRAIEGGYDVRPVMAKAMLAATAFLLVVEGAVMGTYAYNKLPVPELLIGLMITTATWIMAKVSTMVDYGFGTSRSSAGKDAAVEATTQALIQNARVK